MLNPVASCSRILGLLDKQYFYISLIIISIGGIIKITIDTNKDSHNDIKKAIAMLSSLIGEKAYTNEPKNMFSENSDAPEQEGLFGMFNENPDQNKETKEEVPKIIEY